MAVIESPSGVTQEVDNAFKAARVSLRPPEVSGWQIGAFRTGLVTGLAANSAVFSLRNISANQLLVRRVGIGFIATAGFTAPQEIAFGLIVARNFTASDTGQTAIAFTGNNIKARTTLATLTSVDARISSTAALGAGTKTLDTNHIGIVTGWAAAATAGAIVPLGPTNLLQHDPGDHPIVLAQNEGINIQNLVLMGAGGAGIITVTIEFAEALAY